MSNNEPELTGEIEEALERYVEIQAEEQRMQEEKAMLQEKLKAHVAPTGCRNWVVEVKGVKRKVVYRETTDVEYDEDLLRTRLGDRYEAVLSPDMKKIRAKLPELAAVLSPVLTTIGSTDPAKVRAAIETGSIGREEFAGAFRKVRKQSVAVYRVKPGD